MRRRQPLKSNKLKKWLAAPYAVWAAGFIIIPLILILYYAFTGEEGGFTLSNFAYVATKENIKALGLALWLSLLSTALCLLLAYPLAMILANRNVNQTRFIVLIFILPMWMNFLLRTLAWQTPRFALFVTRFTYRVARRFSSLPSGRSSPSSSTILPKCGSI